jgi:hypothetical protein
LMAWKRRRQLIFFGYSESEILRLGDLGKLSNTQMNELTQARAPDLETLEKGGHELGKSALRAPVFFILESSDQEQAADLKRSVSCSA